MNAPATISEAIRRSAKTAPARGFRFLAGEKGGERFYSFAQIEKETARLSGALRDIDLKSGDRMAIIVPDNDAFVLSFLAAIRAGIIPVPIYPPSGLGQLGGYLDNTRHIVAKSGAKIVVTVDAIKPLLGSVKRDCPDLARVATFAELEKAGSRSQEADVGPGDIAFLQFTSGSTSRPKGVILTHENLIANARNIMVEGLRADPEEYTGFTWLPLFHDMGLIGFVIAPLCYAVEVTFMTSLEFLKRPATWLKGISNYKARCSFGPNFAYGLCVKRIQDSEIEGIDLSNWRHAGCGAEPIRPETLESFAARFSRFGFKREAFVPAYGMAESTLAISFDHGIEADAVEASTLWAKGEAVRASKPDSSDTLRITSCGAAFAGHQIGVFSMEDERSQRPLPDRTIGEIRLKGPSVTSGYYDEPELSRDAFAGDWFRTGDMGYLVDGRVFLCGRYKEVIIVNGRNFYPTDIEWEAGMVDGVRRGNVMAFSSSGDDPERERVVLVFETSLKNREEQLSVISRIRARVRDAVGLALDDVVPLSLGVLPKTSSGKLMRRKTSELYESGELYGLKSRAKADRVDQVKQVVLSRLHYFKFSIFGPRKKDPEPNSEETDE